MKRAFLLAAVLAAACAGPKPCTRTLCVTKLEGTMEQTGWSGAVRATSETPKPPVMNDATVKMVFGSAELRNGKTVIAASEGAEFKFFVTTRAVASIEVLSGPMTVTTSSGPALAMEAGKVYVLPKAK